MNYSFMGFTALFLLTGCACPPTCNEALTQASIAPVIEIAKQTHAVEEPLTLHKAIQLELENNLEYQLSQLDLFPDANGSKGHLLTTNSVQIQFVKQEVIKKVYLSFVNAYLYPTYEQQLASFMHGLQSLTNSETLKFQRNVYDLLLLEGNDNYLFMLADLQSYNDKI